MKLVLDTNIYCDFAEGVPDVVDSIAEFGEELYLPTIVIAELTYGFMKGTQLEYNERKLQEIISKLDICVIDIDRNVSRKYALIYLHLFIYNRTKNPHKRRVDCRLLYKHRRHTIHQKQSFRSH